MEWATINCTWLLTDSQIKSDEMKGFVMNVKWLKVLIYFEYVMQIFFFLERTIIFLTNRNIRIIFMSDRIWFYILILELKQAVSSHMTLEWSSYQYLWWNWPMTEGLHQTTAIPAHPSDGSAQSTPSLEHLQVDLWRDRNARVLRELSEWNGNGFW